MRTIFLFLALILVGCTQEEVENCECTRTFTFYSTDPSLEFIYEAQETVYSGPCGERPDWLRLTMCPDGECFEFYESEGSSTFYEEILKDLGYTREIEFKNIYHTRITRCKTR